MDDYSSSSCSTQALFTGGVTTGERLEGTKGVCCHVLRNATNTAVTVTGVLA
jgi:hypothetical protein